jgi:hypothetical protein
MIEAYRLIVDQQRAWAYQHGIGYDKDGYTLRLTDNLYRPLSPVTLEEFKHGRGDELGNVENRGKMQALHSSSALAVNVFEYWRNRNIAFIAEACGASSGISKMRFEATYPTPLGGIPPHLDIEFTGTFTRALVVESKFTETYRRHTRRRFKRAYISTPLLWSGLPNCEALAKLIYDEQKGQTSFNYLDAPQLLKHMLGLNYENRFKEKGFTLLYLWYEIPSIEADKHRSEIESFKKAIGQDIDFQVLTYQELFQRIKGIPGTDQSYLSYLGVRYFPA